MSLGELKWTLIASSVESSRVSRVEMEFSASSVLIICFCLNAISVQSVFINVYPKYKTLPVIGDPGKPLLLTPYIESGDIQEARQLSLVGNLPGAPNVTSYTGYFTVNKRFNSNIFFWFFPAEIGYEAAPVLLWLNGGPGATSLFGLFTENGPFYIEKQTQTLKRRRYSWSKNYSVIFIDNPVGTGYSFTDDVQGYAKTETDVGKDLYQALIQFFQLFPELQKNEFFVTGESYAGKYLPAIAYTIHSENPGASLKINLKGIAIGNGYCDPENMLNLGNYIYEHGLIDGRAREVFQAKEALALKYIKEKKWIEAFTVMDETMDGDLSSYKSFFYNTTGFTFYYNYLHDHDESPFGDLGKFVQSSEVRKAIHVGDRVFNDGREVEIHLKEDVMQSVRHWVEILLDSRLYRVLVYNGQLDIAVPYPLTISFLNALQWYGSSTYANATREKWIVNGKLAGYFKTAGVLTEVLVRNSGHMVPTDQPNLPPHLEFLDGLPELIGSTPFNSV